MSADHTKPESAPRRDFLLLTAQAMGAVGAASLLWPLIDSMNPSADVLALASTEVDLSAVAEGQEIKVVWRGKPVFIRRRTQKNIDAANATDISTLRDPETDAARVKKGKESWLVMVGVCTHLGCVDRKSTRLNSSHLDLSRMPSSA